MTEAISLRLLARRSFTAFAAASVTLTSATFEVVVIVWPFEKLLVIVEFYQIGRIMSNYSAREPFLTNSTI